MSDVRYVRFECNMTIKRRYFCAPNVLFKFSGFVIYSHLAHNLRLGGDVSLTSPPSLYVYSRVCPSVVWYLRQVKQLKPLKATVVECPIAAT